MKDLVTKITSWGGATVIAVVMMAALITVIFVSSAKAPVIEGVSEDELAAYDEGAFGEDFGEIEPAAGADSGEKANKDCGSHYDWIGQKADTAMFKKSGKPFRVLSPNSMMTMDHNPERINIHLDNAGIIEDVKCG